MYLPTTPALRVDFSSPSRQLLRARRRCRLATTEREAGPDELIALPRMRTSSRSPDRKAGRSSRRGKRGRHPVAVANRLVPSGGDPGAPEQIAGEVEGVGARHHHFGTSVSMAAHLAQQRRRLRRGVLLARHTGHEATTEGLPAGLEPTEGADDLAPGNPVGLVPPQLPEDHAPTVEQLPGDRLGQLLGGRSMLGADARGVGSRQQGPTSLTGAGADRGPLSTEGRPTGRPAPAGRGRGVRRAASNERTAEKASAVTMPRATKSQRPSSTSSGSRPEAAGRSARKQAPRRAQRGEHVGRGTCLRLEHFLVTTNRSQGPGQILTGDQGEWGGRRRRHRPAAEVLGKVGRPVGVAHGAVAAKPSVRAFCRRRCAQRVLGCASPGPPRPGRAPVSG